MILNYHEVISKYVFLVISTDHSMIGRDNMFITYRNIFISIVCFVTLLLDRNHSGFLISSLFRICHYRYLYMSFFIERLINLTVYSILSKLSIQLSWTLGCCSFLCWRVLRVMSLILVILVTHFLWWRVLRVMSLILVILVITVYCWFSEVWHRKGP